MMLPRSCSSPFAGRVKPLRSSASSHATPHHTSFCGACKTSSFECIQPHHTTPHLQTPKLPSPQTVWGMHPSLEWLLHRGFVRCRSPGVVFPVRYANSLNVFGLVYTLVGGGCYKAGRRSTERKAHLLAAVLTIGLAYKYVYVLMKTCVGFVIRARIRALCKIQSTTLNTSFSLMLVKFSHTSETNKAD